MKTIDELESDEQKAFAKELKNIICGQVCSEENISEREIIRSFIFHSYKYDGIKSVLDFLKSTYAQSTYEKICKKISKFSKSVVLDTSITNLPFDELEALFNSDLYFIFPNLIIQEIQTKLSPELNNYEKIKYICSQILNDTNSTRTAIIEIPKVSSYTDDSLLEFCKRNGYTLYTYDYILGIRAKCLKINVKICHTLKMKVPTYVPNPDGPNVILTTELFKNSDLCSILAALKLLNANKIIVTYDFINYAESLHAYRNFINFFINDDKGNYMIFTDKSFSDFPDMRNFCETENAIFLTATLPTSFLYKQYFVPYLFIPNKSKAKELSVFNNLDCDNLTNELCENVCDCDESNDVCVENDVIAECENNIEVFDKSTLKLISPPYFNKQSCDFRIRKDNYYERVIFTNSNGAIIKPYKTTVKSDYYHYENGNIMTIFSAISENEQFSYSMTQYELSEVGNKKGALFINEIDFNKNNFKNKIHPSFHQYANYLIFINNKISANT